MSNATFDDDDVDWHEFNQKWLAPVCLISVSIASLSVLLLLAVLCLISCRARNDKTVRQVGLGFLIYLILGGICGQGLLLAYSIQIYEFGIGSWMLDENGSPLMSSWAQCHVQPTLLFLHLGLHAAPLSAKLWRVWYKIRTAETRRLHLWDQHAQRLAYMQLLLLVGTMIGHWALASGDYDLAQTEARADCIRSTNAVQVRAALWRRASLARRQGGRMTPMACGERWGRGGRRREEEAEQRASSSHHCAIHRPTLFLPLSLASPTHSFAVPPLSLSLSPCLHAAP